MKTQRFSGAALATLIGAVVLVGSEILATAGAAAWAIAGMTGFGQNGFYVLFVIFGGLALFATAIFARQAVKSEPIRQV